MRIFLKKLSITNFKGIAHLVAIFNHVSNIYGENAAGKTTIFDAFLWLFFGKNTEGKSDFEVKRLDERGKFIKDLEAEVEAIIQVDNVEIAVKKVLRQKWVKRRGELTANYSGDENVYYWNDVPLKESEFRVKIKGIIDEGLFRLITDPFYFNSLKWQDRRNILIDMAGIGSDKDILTGLNKFDGLLKELSQGKTLKEYQAQISEKKKKIKDESESIPSRIDEVRRGMPQVQDFQSLRTRIEELTKELSSIQGTLNDEVSLQAAENKSRAEALKDYHDAVRAHQQKTFDLKTRLQNIEFEVKQQANQPGIDAEINFTSRQIGEKKLDLERYTNAIKQFESQLSSKEQELEGLRDKYAAENARELSFSDHDFTCPTCQQHLPDETVLTRKETLTANFNLDKKKNLDDIVSKGNALRQEVEGLKTRIKSGKETAKALAQEISDLETKLGELKDTEREDPQETVNKLLLEHMEYNKIQSELRGLEQVKFIEPVFPPLQTNEELKKKSQEINEQIFSLQRELANEENIKRADARIEELRNQESALAQKLAELEGIEFSILEFTKAKVEMIERKINSKFKFVKFKMFHQQINGGESECCETLINSNGSYVPFSDANNAARINAGIDIINVLCEHYEAYAPIFLDNRESVTKIIDTDSQIINLIVREGQKTLKVDGALAETYA